LKDQFAFTSLLAIGATLVSLLYLAIGRAAFFLAPLLLAVRTIDALLQAKGVKKNPHMENAITSTKVSGQYPNSAGEFGNKPADGQIAVFMIGARNNHPLGVLDTEWVTLSSYFVKMQRDVERNALEYGLLGAQGWIADGQRDTNNEVMTVMFFRDAEGIQKYAHGPLHKEGWSWWYKNEAKHKHLGIWHEIFVAPKGMWETIYVNGTPLGFGSSTFPVKGEDGKVMWQSPLVDASRGLLRTSKGRMSRSDGKDHEKYEWDQFKGRS
jgi:hypothetical protein